MGQQQLLLIILGVIIVGLAIFTGINLFTANAIETKRNNLINECVNLASMAQQHYRRPAELGGGGRTFDRWVVPVQLRVTASGRYTSAVESQKIIITAVGNEVVTGSDSVEVQFTILPDEYATRVIH
ncbi:MAG: hypothetical protein KKA84_01515 [Bacteroidetes bacterium]|nr:hypothetical protein [Bacteroidota bacterium]